MSDESRQAQNGRCDGDNNRVITVFNRRYCTAAAFTNSSLKQQVVVDLALNEGLLDLRQVPFNAAQSWLAITGAHDRTYVEAVRSGRPRQLAESQGFRWSPAFASAVARIWSGHLGACRLARERGMVFHPASGAHHAGYSSGSAFCTFNFLAGAARDSLRQGVSPVAIIDLDAHAGNGTHELVGGQPGIALFDIAGGMWDTVVNTPWTEYHIAEDAQAYQSALDRLPAFLDRVRPALVQYQAGMDPFEDDPVGRTPGVDEAFLRARDRFVIEEVRNRGIPVVVNIAGGYVEGRSERLHLNTVRVMAERVARECQR